jgi:hypothetical protein
MMKMTDVYCKRCKKLLTYQLGSLSLGTMKLTLGNHRDRKIQPVCGQSYKLRLCKKCFFETRNDGACDKAGPGDHCSVNVNNICMDYIEQKKEVKPMKTTFRTLAEKILSESKDPLTAKAIWEKASETGLAAELGSGGKTPWNTLAALLYTDVQKKGDASVFIQTSKSPPLFQLRNNAPTAEPVEIAPPEPQEGPKAANKPAKPVKAAKKKNRTAKEILEDMAKSDDPAVRKKLNEVDRLAKAAEERLKK